MPIIPELVTAALIYKRNEAMLAKAIDGLTCEQWLYRPQESSNNALWIVGHIACTRATALKLLGVPWTAAWFKYFERGSKPEDASQYPSYDEVLAAWKELSDKLPPAIEAASAEAMAAPVSQPSPSLDGTIGGLVSFLAMHESYHVGQAVYVRRLVSHNLVAG